ncbi:NADP-dependent oxidoreductase [Streptomyces sp. NBRC 109706]|uniref:NADP-dependent oxidoreductase n=1 Tax=Streptomyces sp. NBRC 109706 TaxID=1550035 RepID=UPI00078641E6|nr:NADP-dependent oxidoreductase [Streptomyces sp. NBRC 109706]
MNQPPSTTPATPTTAVAVHQVARPDGFPTADHFRFVEGRLPTPEQGTALVENVYWSVDPYHREMMDGAFALNAPLEGRTIGRVIESRAPELPEGALLLHRHGWRTHAVVRPDEVRLLPSYAGVPLSAHLGILGGTGLSAYVALTRIAQLQHGQDVFVTAAAGGVGTATARLGRLLGAGRLIGSAGSAAKVAHLTEHVGYDIAFDYHEGPIVDALRAAAPDGVDRTVDNVGGEHLEAAIDVSRDHARIAWVGAIGQYNSPEPPPAPRNLFDLVGRSIRLEGFLVRDYQHVQQELYDFAVPHIQSGRLGLDATVVTGFDQIVNAFLGMLRGENVGKMIVAATDQADQAR